MAVSYKVKKGNIFGRIGEGFGHGLAQQGQKELDRYQLRQGLEDVANNSEGLTPFQRFTKLSSVPGITPQQVESGTRLLEREAQRNAYRNPRSNEQEREPSSNASPKPSIQEVAFSPTKAGVGMRKEDQPKGSIPEAFPNREEQAKTGERIVQENPINKKFIPGIPWTQDKLENEVSRLLVRHPTMTPDEAFARARENEARELARPLAEQERQQFLENRQNEAEAELDKQLEIALQKEGKEVYADLSGDNLLDLRKAMADDLATDPNLTSKQAAEKWRRKGKDFVERKNIMKAKAARDIETRLSPIKKNDTLDSLIAARPAYKDMGKTKEFYDTLKSDFDLSPAGAALIAYPRSPGLKSVIKENEKGKFPVLDTAEKSRGFGKSFLEKATSEDSVLAFMKSAQNHFPSFDARAYMRYLNDNIDKLTPDQQKEVEEGVGEFFPNWGDLALFPYFGRSKVDD